MDRKTLVAAVGAVALTLVAASSAMAVNLGILDSSSDSPAGGLLVVPGAPATTVADPAATGADDPEVIHLTVRDLPPTGTAVTGATGAAGTPVKAAPAPAPAAASTAAPSQAGHDDHDDDEHDDDDEDEHEDERHDTRRPRRGDDDDD